MSIKGRSLKLKRIYTPQQTLGKITVYDIHGFPFYECKSLELADHDNQRRISCIPEGSYKVIKHVSPTFGKCFWIKDVPNRSEILIHPANYAGSKNPRTGRSDLLGCIATGEYFKDLDGDGIRDIAASKNALKRLLQFMPNEFSLIIYS